MPVKGLFATDEKGSEHICESSFSACTRQGLSMSSLASLLLCIHKRASHRV